MGSTPTTSSQRSKAKLSSSRLSKASEIPRLCIEGIAPSSPKTLASSPSPASTVSPKPPYTLPLRELLTLSPSPVKRSKKARLADAEDVAAFDVKKKCKNRNGNNPSPRINRRSQRRGFEQDGARDDFAQDEVLVKARKKRHGESNRSKAISSAPLSAPLPSISETCGGRRNLDVIGELIRDLVMWKDVSKSSLWFGFGSLCFLSSCFAKSVSFSIFSLMSQFGLLCLVLSFFFNTIRQRETGETKRELMLTEEDVMKIGRLVLPAANLAISKGRIVFSGEPAMTLRVVPLLLLGAEYGHLISVWRLCALVFFVSFTVPKLFSAYASQLSKKVENVKSRMLNSWGNCTHKRIVVASAVTGFWNLTSVRTRVIAAFLCLVVLRYRNQHIEEVAVKEDAPPPQSQEMAIVAVEDDDAQTKRLADE